MTTVSRTRVVPMNRRGRTSMTGRLDHTKIRLGVAPVEPFSARLAALMKARGMSYGDLAKATGLPKDTVLNAPKRPGVTAFTVSRIAAALGVTMDYLWRGES